jgi:GTP cyclohydrolase IA
MRRSAGSPELGESSEELDLAEVESGQLAKHYHAILSILGVFEKEPDFLDLSNTPRRMEKMMVEELLSSYRSGALEALKDSFTTFPAPRKKTAMVVVKDVPYWSLCCHHGIPFFGKADVGYIPDKVIVGLSKIPRTVKFFASKFQMQERLVDEIADFLEEMLKPKAIIVRLSGQHLCVAMRGVAVAGVDTVTSALRGMGYDDRVKHEFYTLIGK